MRLSFPKKVIVGDKINNCLHCGSEAHFFVHEISGRGYDDGYTVYLIKCSKCNIQTAEYADRNSPFEIWNIDKRK